VLLFFEEEEEEEKAGVLELVEGEGVFVDFILLGVLLLGVFLFTLLLFCADMGIMALPFTLFVFGVTDVTDVDEVLLKIEYEDEEEDDDFEEEVDGTVFDV
jgi:hypothetical protein